MTARKFASVKFPDAFVENARREAALFNRSVAGQIEHWARLGRALEGAPGVSGRRVKDTLQGRVTLQNLTKKEQEALLDDMHEWLKIPSDEEVAAYAALADLPGAVGTNGTGEIMRGPAKPRLRKAS